MTNIPAIPCSSYWNYSNAIADDVQARVRTSVTTATRLVVILEKSIYALRMGEAIGLVTSRTSTMRTDMIFSSAMRVSTAHSPASAEKE